MEGNLKWEGGANIMPETADQYRQRMFSYLDGRDPVKLQAAAPAKLRKLLTGISPVRARKRPAPGKWSIAEIVAHLADTELVGGYRIRAILGAPGGQLDHPLGELRLGQAA